jgi:Zn-dependent protease with chaperone function
MLQCQCRIIATPEDDLAVILGHEIAHAVARHSTEKLTYLLPILTIGLLAESSPIISWVYITA